MEKEQRSFRLSNAEKDKIVELYKQGQKIDDITQEMDRSRGAVFGVLRERGLKANRYTQAAPAVSAADMIEVVRELEARHARCRAALGYALTQLEPNQRTQVRAMLGEDASLD